MITSNKRGTKTTLAEIGENQRGGGGPLILLTWVRVKGEQKAQILICPWFTESPPNAIILLEALQCHD